MRAFIRETPKPSQNPPEPLRYQVVVVGGGMSGLIAAPASACQARRACVRGARVLTGQSFSKYGL